MPVSFAVLEYESEGLKSPCAGGGSRPITGLPGWWHPPPALPLLEAEDGRQTEGNEFASPGRAKNAARERRSVRDERKWCSEHCHPPPGGWTHINRSAHPTHTRHPRPDRGSLSTGTTTEMRAGLVLSPQNPDTRRTIPGQAGDDVNIWRGACTASQTQPALFTLAPRSRRQASRARRQGCRAPPAPRCPAPPAPRVRPRHRAAPRNCAPPRQASPAPRP